MGRWNGGYIRNFPLLPFWVPIAPTVLRVVGPTDPQSGTVVELSSILDKFVFVLRSSAAIQKYGVPKTIGFEILAKFFGHFAPL